jgi:hypothetical protein
MPELLSPHSWKKISRSFFVIIAAFSGLGVLAALIFGGLMESSRRLGHTTVEVSIASSAELKPALPLPPDASVQYSKVYLDVPAWQTPAEPLLTIAHLLPYISGGITSLVVFVIAIRRLRGKELGTGTAISMFVVAGVSVFSAMARPMMLARGEQIFVEALGVPTTSTAAEYWVTTAGWSLQDTEWSMLILGILIGIGGWLALQMRQLSRDIEGTI